MIRRTVILDGIEISFEEKIEGSKKVLFTVKNIDAQESIEVTITTDEWDEINDVACETFN